MTRPLAIPIVAVSVTLALGCGGAVPQPPIGPVPESALFEVPYPPPAGRVERIPERPNLAALWIDGQWDWDGRRWVWQDGGWVETPDGAAYFTPWMTKRAPDGSLLFAPAAWRRADGTALVAFRPLDACVAGERSAR